MSTTQTEFRNWIIALRNDFHKHPELSANEKRTTKKICEVLKTLDAHVQTFEDMTGVVAVFKGEKQDLKNAGTIALRADIDALPLDELGNKDNKSRNAGVMHACGHDANTAIVLGVAKKIRDTGLLKEINGTIKFIFQPSEERLGGAKAMIENGVLENPKVDRIIAGHMDPNLPVGTVGVFERIGHAASDPFELVITGKGTHGARPHQGVNPITGAGMFVSSLDSIIPRHINPALSAVISVGTCHSGDAGNVIPEQAILTGSIRTHDEDARERIFKALKNLVQGIDTVLGTRSELNIRPGAPLGVNDPQVCKSLHAASEAVLGKEKVKTLPFIMGSEDFYYFTQKCPGAIMRFGCTSKKDNITYPLHSPFFDLHEDVLEIGANILFKAVEKFFKKK
jgi:amidohydrolase